MKVSTNWLKQLVDLKVDMDEVIRLLPLRTIGTKEVTPDFFELDMKGYNRADLLSMRGVAYEIAAITDSKVNFKEPEESEFEWNKEKLPEADVWVEETNLTPLYCIARIEGLKVEKSPEEWVKKLADSGMRSVNNIADITNLIMLEYGQPMHAFDADQIARETLIVRTAKEGEEFKTLDEKTRKLLPTDLVIADPEKAVGLAGVMGGKNSEVTEDTHTILLEAAIFDPITLRETAGRLSLQSEASKRFQHGLTKKRTLQAFDAAIKMYQALGGKLTAASIVGDTEDKLSTINLREEKVNSLIGLDIKAEDIENYLKRLYFYLEKEDGKWKVIVPYFRLDIEIEEDLIEEVARMYGYEKIPAKELPGNPPAKIDQTLFNLVYDLKVKLVELGLTEIQTYSFYSTAVLNNLGLNKEDLIRVTNPMSAETEYLREDLWPNLVEKVVENLKYFSDVAIFEVGKVYNTGESAIPEEKYRLSISFADGSENPAQKLYSVLEKLNLNAKVGEKIENKLFHPTRAFKLDNKGLIAEVHPRVTNKFGTEKRIAVLEIKIV